MKTNPSEIVLSSKNEKKNYDTNNSTECNKRSQRQKTVCIFDLYGILAKGT